MTPTQSPTERLVLYGAGALAREILVVLSRLHAAGREIEFVACLVDPDIAVPVCLHNRPVSRDIENFAGDDNLRFVVALGEPKARARAVERLRSIGARFASIIDPAVLIGASSTVGEGSMILGHASITADAELGSHVLVNPGTTIAHDNRIGDFATLSPGVHLAGHVIVEEGAFLGTGASVIPGIRIGAHAIVGAGAVVIRDVLPGHTVVGNPARILRRD
ncbi:2,3,4,5-tetrahydropyridine-2,6-dicarboxylate N-acetyltransferase [Methylobacterium mesophilicum]|uniref:acetyltransferase n=1 Tax=Methylobacterium mesophilicum TaxID=39956 RepID=UPI001EE2496D|nr:acetyltransferase [Methylobacterium mesophilicum]GJE22642.1 2,3,4,5-tetrahydropyridine-2,6-dicarboxylate N-acetyltransferase [Methylobacterium mesophilicum]